MRGTKRGCAIEIFENGQMFIKRVVLRDVCDITSQRFQIAVQRFAIHQDLAVRWLALTANGFKKRAFSGAAGSHDTDHLSPVYRERHPVQGDLAVFKAERKIPNLEMANDISLFLNNSLGEIASQDLPGIDTNNV